MTCIAPWSPEWARPSPAAFDGLAAAGAAARRDRGEAFAWLFALACALPYPALAVGNKTGVQLSHLLALAAAPVLALRPPGRSLYALLFLVGPVYVSGFVSLLRDAAPEAAVIPKEAVSLTLAFCVLWPSGWLAGGRRFRGVMTATAAAILGHALVGLYQLHAFSNDEFPLLAAFRNPSFKAMESWSDEYARYIKRPFGLFPEPSAMAASLGPFVVVLAGLLADPGAAVRFGLGRKTRALFTAALFAGFLLLALSRSGLTVAVMAAVLAVSLGSARARFRAAGPWALVAFAATVAAAGGVVTYLAVRTGSALDQRIESSWGLRAISIVTALTANTDPLDLAFGVGPGQSTPVVRRLLAGVPKAATQDDMAVWSLVAGYYMEHGLVGGAGMLALAVMAGRAVARSSAVVLGLGAGAVWLAGVAVTTSYYHLSAVWLFLGLLLHWDRVFLKGPRAGGAVS